MVADHVVAGGTFAAVGAAVLVVGYLVRFRGRVDLLANFTGAADPGVVAVNAGNLVLATGTFLVAFGAADAYWNLSAPFVAVAIAVVVVLAFVTAVRAQGY